MKLKIIRSVKNLHVHCVVHNKWIASEGLNLFISSDQGRNWVFFNRIPCKYFKGLLIKNSIFNRLIRGGVNAILPVNQQGHYGWVISAEKQLFFIPCDNAEIETLSRLIHGRRPLRRGICVIDDSVLWGDYWGNPERGPVRINAVDFDRRYKILYEFSKNTVRHIHTIQLDPFTDMMWISTGDNDSECIVAILDPKNPESLKIIGQGSQKWRTVSFAFKSDAVFWGTDNHLGSNQILRFDRRTASTDKVGDVIGPVYYNLTLNDYSIFGTTMEKGEGQQDGFGRLYAIDENNGIEEVWKQEKDCWDARLFGYGIFEFAEGSPGNNLFWVTAKGFKGGQRSILFRLEND